ILICVDDVNCVDIEDDAVNCVEFQLLLCLDILLGILDYCLNWIPESVIFVRFKMNGNTYDKDNSGGLNNATHGTARISFRDKLVGESSIKYLGFADSLVGEKMASIDFKTDDDITAITFSSEARNALSDPYKEA
ncbi:hypothetical protein PIB30_113906, partial [Stylosanthes scabra]|nr:hypothetical protein [Stylosanthes scabra]